MSAPNEPLNELTPEEARLGEALHALRPALPAALDPMRIAFEAGRRTAQRSLLLWRGATAAAMVVCSLALLRPQAASVFTDQAPSSQHPFAVAPAAPAPNEMAATPIDPAPSDPTQQRLAMEALRGPPTAFGMRDVALGWGIEALPAMRSARQRSEPLNQSPAMPGDVLHFGVHPAYTL